MDESPPAFRFQTLIMDVLTDFLRTLGATPRVDGPATLDENWKALPGGTEQCRFVLVAEGTVRLELSAGSMLDLGPGEVLFLFTGNSVRLRSISEASSARIVTGEITFIVGISGEDGLGMPELLKIQPAKLTEPIISRLISEVSAVRPGWESIAGSLTMCLFIEALREHGTSPSATTTTQHGWLRGVGDPEIGHAIKLMHERPAHPWTVGELADQLAVSRSTFAARFKTVTGRPPLTYLCWWRLCRAAARLRLRDGASIAQVARDAGYETETAFGKAFRRQFGRTPGQIRREGNPRRSATALQSELKKRDPFSVPEQETSLNLARTAAWIGIAFEKLFADHGLSSAQFNVLRILRGFGDSMTLEEVASRLVTPNRNPVEIMDSLRIVGRIDELSPGRFVIAEPGRQVLAALDKPVVNLHRRQLSHFTTGELAELDRLLVKAREHLYDRESSAQAIGNS